MRFGTDFRSYGGKLKSRPGDINREQAPFEVPHFIPDKWEVIRV